MTASVSRLGVLQPISVRFIEAIGRYRIIAGECRFTAARNAGLTEVPCLVKTPDDADILLEQIVENWQRSDLNPFELADSLAHLRDGNGLSQAALAKATGKSAGEISKLLSILSINPDVQRVARDDESGLISKRHLYAISRLDADGQSRAIVRIKQQNMSALDAERFVARLTQKADAGRKSGATYQRRSFDVLGGSVTFSFHRNDVTDDDILAAIAEVKKQVQHRDGLYGSNA